MTTATDLAARVDLLIEHVRWSEAEQAARRLVAQEPGSASAHRRLAHALCGLGRYDDAVEPATQACRLAPDDPWSLMRLSLVRMRLHDPAAAVDAAERAVQIAPLEWWAHETLAVAHMARTDGSDVTSASDPVSALMAADEAVRIDPSRVEGHVTRGRALNALGRRREAERAYLTAGGLSPTSSAPLNNIGWIHLKRRPLHAARYFTAAISRDPQSEIYRLNLTGVIVMWIFRMVCILLCGGVALAAVRWVLPTPLRAAILVGLATTCVVGSAVLYRRLPRRSLGALWGLRRLRCWMVTGRMVSALTLAVAVTFCGRVVWTVVCVLLVLSVVVEWKVKFGDVAERITQWHQRR